MAKKNNHYSPPPRRKSANLVKKDLHKRLRGKPTRSTSMLSLPRTIILAVQRSIVIVIILLLIAGFTLAGLGGGMLVGYITTAEEVVTDQIKSTNETTKILDQDGNEIAVLTGRDNINRVYISFSEVKDTYIDEAFMAIEDERFFDHIGIDIQRIASAVLSALSNGGTPTHGGSTITQQAVKLISGEGDVSAQRKVQEWYKAILLEKQKSKDEIMELYVNLVPMGNSYVGIQSAATAYFGKDASELSLAECAFLAGVPNGPSIYNPMTENGRRNALRRMRIVLGMMHELGYIEDDEYTDALNTELIFNDDKAVNSGTQVLSYFVEYVIDTVKNDLVTNRGISEPLAASMIYNNGLTIKTTMDPDVQAKMEETFNTRELFVSNEAAIEDLPEDPQGSMVVISNGSDHGQVKGMVGGYGEKTANLVINRATDAARQPGSSIKPLAVYGPGIDTGYITPATIYDDHEISFETNQGTWSPKNSYSGYKGLMTIRSALTNSVNTVAVQILDRMKTETALQYLNMVGLDRYEDEGNLSMALGAFTNGMSTLEMASAYTIFPNNGLYTAPYCYTEVLDVEGNVLLSYSPEFTEVLKPASAYVMISMMHDVVTSGTATSIGGYIQPGIYTAGKTGTTDNNRDKWFCGYTPYYTASVWYGYDNKFGSTEIYRYDRSNAIKIWKDAMVKIHEGLDGAGFDKPNGVTSITICTESGEKATQYCRDAGTTRSEIFVSGSIMNPSTDCSLHLAPTPTPEPLETVPAETKKDNPGQGQGNNDG